MTVGCASLLGSGAWLAPHLSTFMQDPMRVNHASVPMTAEARRAACFDQFVDERSQKSADSSLADTVVQATFSHRDSLFLEDCLIRLRIIGRLLPEAARLAGLHLSIPEFHDEQRFRASADRFGPRVMIFASPNLQGFTHPDQVTRHDARGLLAAVVYVDTNSTGALGMPEYDRLNLRPGLNCVFVVLGSGGAWFGRVAQAKHDTCDEEKDAQTLRVVRRDLAAFQPDQIPPVARFTFDASGMPLLSMKCLTGWCHLGPNVAGWDPTSLAQGVTELAAMHEKVQVVGWHDEQVLANYDANGMAVPGRVRATVIPSNIVYRTDAQLCGATEPIGYVFLHNSPAGTRYADWGLSRGLNQIWLSCAPDGTIRYLIRAADGRRTTWTDAARHPHLDAVVVPTARFRWVSSDDGAWFGCGQYCCRADGHK